MFTAQDLAPIRGALERKMDRIADALHRTGLITDTHADAPFEVRMERLAAAVPGLPNALHGDRSAVTAMRDLCELWSSPRMLDMVEQLLGTPEIAGHSVINLRIRTATPPDGAGPESVDLHAVPFHQDAAYLLPEADSTLQVGIWLPLVDVPAEAGCLSFLKGGHTAAAGVCLPHVPAEDGTGFLQLDPEVLQELLEQGCEAVPCPVPLGSFVLFNNLVPHAGLPNTAGATRWSVDMRWQATDQPHGDDHNSGLVPFRSAAPGWTLRRDAAGPKAVRPPTIPDGRWAEAHAAAAAAVAELGPEALAARERKLEAHRLSQERVGRSVTQVREATAALLPWAEATPSRFFHQHEL